MPCEQSRFHRDNCWPMTRASLLALTFVTLVTPCAGGDPKLRPAAMVVGAPTKQPPTRGQDSQRCGTIALPEVINFAPKEENGFYKEGVWENRNGATMATWYQDLFAFNFDTVDFYTPNGRLIVRSRVLSSPRYELEAMGIWLPPWDDDMQCITTVLKDCENVPMYIIRSTKDGKKEIFNHLGQLIARGNPGEMIDGQLFFKDHEDQPIAIAQSPIITGSEDTAPRPVIDDPHTLQPWQVWFPSGYTSKSGLRDPEKRYVIMSIVSEEAVRSVMQIRGTLRLEKPASHIFFVLFCVAVLLAGIALIAGIFLYIFRTIYPLPRRPNEDEFHDFNPFLHNVPKTYDTMTMRGTGKANY